MPSQFFKPMSNVISRPNFSNNPYDLLIIGGGINGAAIANIASSQGLSVALIEKKDFASGTSSKSTKLMHGGLRYLENFEFDLVRESLQERTIQLHKAPHLVKPLKFILPVYKSDRRPFWMIKLGIAVYDILSGKSLIKRRESLGVSDLLTEIPGIKKEGLVGGVSYYDAQMDDTRLCLENILMAKSRGAHVANYVEAQEFLKENQKIVGVKAWDVTEKRFLEIRAKRIVCALGPWTNEFFKKSVRADAFKVRTTKGVHIVYRGKFSNDAVIFPTVQDKRVLFVIPFPFPCRGMGKGNSLIGTTDTDFSGNPDDVKVEKEDIDYLFKELNRVFPDHSFRRENILTSFAGLRPLAHREGHSFDVSRKHVIEETSDGIIYVIGGKYTTYRKIAEDAVSQILKKKIRNAKKCFEVYGSGSILENSQTITREYDVSPAVVVFLMDFYGTRYKDVLEFVRKDHSLKEPLCSCSPIIRAQVRYAIDVEMAKTAEDIIFRRLGLAYLDCPTKDCEKRVKEFFAV